MKKYSVSIVNYLNTLPFVYGLKHDNLTSKLDLQFDVPSVCSDKVLTKSVDIALVPVATLVKLDHYHIITNFCIGSNGPVDSVKLYSATPLENIKAILLDYQSRTSVQLIKILCNELWKINPEFIPAKKDFESEIIGDTAAVIIGDRTFSLHKKYPYEFDLSQAWKKLTGLPFAFAVWISPEKISDQDFLKKFDDALKYGVQHIPDALNENPTIHPEFDAFDYLTNKISYSLDSEKLKAIDLFLSKLEYSRK